MPSFDVLSSLDALKSVAPEVLSADKNGAGIDSQGFEGIVHLVDIGVGGITFTTTNKIELKLEQSDDDSTYTAVTDANHVNVNAGSSDGVVVAPDANGIFATIDGADDDDLRYAIGFRGAKRYSRVVVDFSGTHATGTPISAVALRMRPAHSPV